MKRSDLEWFYRHLRYEIEDRNLEKEGVSLEFYWDASHIRLGALGMAAFYDATSTFQRDLFKQDDTLVCCLAGKGWFGEIKLLQPHEAEFLRLIDADFGIGPVGPPPGGASQFVADSGLRGLNILTTSDLSTLREQDVSEIVKAQAGNADTLFKASYCAIGTWRTRIVNWRRSKLLIPSDEVLPYGPIVNSKEFQKLRECFDRKRPTSHVNNFADAMAICMLASQFRAFSDGARRIPRFFVSSFTYENVLRETGLISFLNFHDGDRQTSVLRHTDYYKLRAMFHLPEAVRKQVPANM